MPIPLHLRRQIGAGRVSPSSAQVPDPTPVVAAAKAKPEPTFVVSPWGRQAPAPPPAPVEEPAPVVEPTAEAAPEPTAAATEAPAEPDFSGLKSNSLKSDLLAYTAFYGLPVDDTNTKAEIWAAIEAHKATLAG